MIKYARYYNWQLDDNLKRIIIAMRQGVTNLPRCSYKDCSKSVYFDVNTKVTTGCCRDHSMKVNNLKKYGVENVNQLKSSVEKTKKTNLEKYGVENVMQNNQIKQRLFKTNLLKYGVKSPLESKIVQEKIKNTNIQKYGVENPFSSEIIKDKIKEIYLQIKKSANVYKEFYKPVQDFIAQHSLKDAYYLSFDVSIIHNNFVSKFRPILANLLRIVVYHNLYYKSNHRRNQ